MRYKDELAGLLRLESSLAGDDELISLDTYVDRMRDKQDEIYYLHAASRKMAEASPYYEAFKKKGLEVIFVYTMADEVVLQNVVDFREKRLVSIESAHVDLTVFPDDIKFASSEAQKNETADAKLSEGEIKVRNQNFFDPKIQFYPLFFCFQQLCTWLKDDALNGKVSEVKISDRLVETPALIADYEGAQMRRMMKYVDPQAAKTMTLPLQKLQINPKHPLIVRLGQIYSSNPEIAKLTAEQLFDNALVNAGLLDDSRTMLPRIHKILEHIVGKKQ